MYSVDLYPESQSTFRNIKQCFKIKHYMVRVDVCRNFVKIWSFETKIIFVPIPVNEVLNLCSAS